MVMGDQKGYDWCLSENIAALFLVRQGEQIVQRATPSFQERIEPNNRSEKASKNGPANHANQRE